MVLRKKKNTVNNEKRDLDDRIAAIREQHEEEEKNVERLERNNRKLEAELLEFRQVASGSGENEKDAELRLERESKRLKQKLDEQADGQSAIEAEKRRLESHINQITEDNRQVGDQVARYHEELDKETLLHKELEAKLDAFLNQFKS